ncbi:MAG: GTPase ObgE [Acidobacteriota bacterium]|nr:GTPase ObgE [Acidobacteriota bacterium]
MSFVDEVEIHVAAGHGGRGALSFRREKFIPRGGPDGGDGGPGGSVYLVAQANLNTLLNFRFQKNFEAGRGGHGEGSNRRGKNGTDVDLAVPIGTVVYEKQADGSVVQVTDLTTESQRVLIAKGGLGGHGNATYATSTNRAPRKFQPGLPGEEKDLRLHLKLLADVGLVGYPNAGKSTMISRISAARPKIADYPFTTLVPNLGVVGLSGDRSFVVADVPGLIEGAHTGHGLGTRFLSHLERTKVLVHIVDVSSMSGRDPVDDYDVITRELALFPGRDASGERLADKPVIVAANKVDALDDPERLARLRAHLTELGIPVQAVSAASGEGLPEMLEAVWREVAEGRARDAATAAEAVHDPVGD